MLSDQTVESKPDGSRASLRERLVAHFSDEELRTLCFDLGVDYESLPAEGKAGKARELVAHLERTGGLLKLVERCRLLRPNAVWEDLSISPRPTPAPASGVRPWMWLAGGIALFCIIFLAIAAAFRPPRPRPVATPSPLGTPQRPTTTEISLAPSATSTQIPTSLRSTAVPTPTPFAWLTEIRRPSKVLVAEFDERRATVKADVAQSLEDDLKARLREYGLNNVSVQIVSNVVSTKDEAQNIARQEGGDAVIWGRYDDNGIKVRIFLAGQDSASEQPLDTKLLPLGREGQPGADLAFVVTKVLPENVSFLSLFVIGHLYYLANQYQPGHAAFDAAMANMPETVELENEAILHFFRARELEALGSDDLAQIVCEYARAIELAPDMVAAYNNLALIQAYREMPDSGTECLKNADLPLSEGDMLERALKLQPNSAVLRYNSLALEWGAEAEMPYTTTLSTLQEIVRDDATLPGPHILLGVIAFEKNDLNTAAEQFSAVRTLQPKSAEVRMNLGQTYLLQGKLNEAKAEFQTAAVINDEDGEAYLALANVAYLQGQKDAAATYLAKIPPWNSELPDSYSGASKMAQVFNSRLYLEDGRDDQAVAALEKIGIDSHDSLTHYLLWLSYGLSGNEKEANIRSELSDLLMLHIRTEKDLAYKHTLDLVWPELWERCGTKDEVQVTEWGTKSNPCLPEDLRARLFTVYDIFQRQLPYRLYYQKTPPVYGEACPYVFTFDSEHREWSRDTTILTNLNSRSLEALQPSLLTRFDGRLLIREMESETSYVDQLFVLVVDTAGREYRLVPRQPFLLTADQQYYVMHPGDEILLTFDDFKSIASPRQARVFARGYYIPLQESVP